jgi:glycosyltransferase involved in cell wall biosynthesis
MTALIVYPEISAFGGEERVLLALCRGLVECGIPYRVITYYDRIDLQRHTDFPLDLIELKPRDTFAAKARALRGAIRDIFPIRGDVLLFGAQAAAHAAFGLPHGFVARIADTPSMLALSRPAHEGWRAKARGALYMALFGLGLRRARLVVANADYLGDELRRAFGVNSQTIYVGGKAPSRKVRRRPRPRADARIDLLSISRLEQNKRLEWILQTAATFAADAAMDRVNFTIVGEGSLEPVLREEIRRRGLSDRVRLAGFVGEDQLEELYAKAGVFLMPAIQGFGLPALEALYRGVPVVVHADSGVCEVLGGTRWAELVTGGPPEFAEATRRLLQRRLSGDLGSPPDLPTEQTFSEAIIRVCGWA